MFTAPIIGVIIFLSFLGLLSIFVVCQQLRYVHRQVDRLVTGFDPDWAQRHGVTEGIGSGILGAMVAEYTASVRRGNDMVNTPVIISRHLNRLVGRWERWVAWTISVCVITGLMGTFLGLSLAIQDIATALPGLQETTMEQLMQAIIDTLQRPLGGMSLAFQTSLAGLVASTILTFLRTVVDNAGRKHRIITELEHFLDNVYYPIIHRDAFREFALALQGRIANSFDTSVDRFGEDVKVMAGRIADTMQGLDHLVEDLARTTEAFQSGADRLWQFGDILQEVTDRLATQTESQLEAATQLAEGSRQVTREIAGLRQDIETARAKSQELATHALDYLTKIDERNAVTASQTQQILAGMKEQQEHLAATLTAFAARLQEFDQTITGRLVEAVDQLAGDITGAADRRWQELLEELQATQAERFGLMAESVQEVAAVVGRLDRVLSVTEETWKKLPLGLHEELTRALAPARKIVDHWNQAQAGLQHTLGELAAGLPLVTSGLAELDQAVARLSEGLKEEVAESFDRNLHRLEQDFNRIARYLEASEEQLTRGFAELETLMLTDGQVTRRLHLQDIPRLAECVGGLQAAVQKLVETLESVTGDDSGQEGLAALLPWLAVRKAAAGSDIDDKTPDERKAGSGSHGVESVYDQPGHPDQREHNSQGSPKESAGENSGRHYTGGRGLDAVPPATK